MVSLTTILSTSAAETELRTSAAARTRAIRVIEMRFIGRERFETLHHRGRNVQQTPSKSYSYSYLRVATDISSAALTAGRAAGAPLQPGRVVLPVISRAPRSYVTYDHAHWMNTSRRFRNPIRKRMWMNSHASQ